jgi:N-methylhydantoinase A
VVYEGRFIKTPIYERGSLKMGAPLTGPAVIEQLDSTTVVPPGYRASMEAGGNVIIEFGEG